MLERKDIDLYLSDLAKQLKKESGKYCRAELVIVGGASIIINYGFRESTNDVDAMRDKLMSMRSCITKVAEKYGLQEDWLNFDFTETASYSPALREHSQYYKTFSNVLSVYTVSGVYLLCMKLVAFRKERHDIQDIVHLLEFIPDVTYDKINTAMVELYGDWSRISDDAINMLHILLDKTS